MYMHMVLCYICFRFLLYSISKHNKMFKINEGEWHTKSEEEKKSIFVKYL